MVRLDKQRNSRYVWYASFLLASKRKGAEQAPWGGKVSAMNSEEISKAIQEGTQKALEAERLGNEKRQREAKAKATETRNKKNISAVLLLIGVLIVVVAVTVYMNRPPNGDWSSFSFR